MRVDGWLWSGLAGIEADLTTDPPVAVAISSAVLIFWGNLVVARSWSLPKARGDDHAEVFTLLSHTSGALLACAVAVGAGLSLKSLGASFEFTEMMPAGRSGTAALFVAVVGFSVVGFVRYKGRRRRSWLLRWVRVLVPMRRR